MQGKNKLLIEYALSGLEQSIAVADWKTKLTETLPPEFQGSLPSIEEIEAELALPRHRTGWRNLTAVFD